MLQALLA